MALYTIAGGTTANRAALSLNTSTTGIAFTNTTGSAVNITYTVSDDAIVHSWSNSNVNVRRYGDTSSASTGFYVATMPAGAGGILSVSGAANQGLRIAAVTADAQPVDARHGTSVANGNIVFQGITV